MTAIAQPDRSGSPFVLYASFAASTPRLSLPDSAAAAEAERALAGITLRGAYLLSGFRAEADVLLWMLGPSAGIRKPLAEIVDDLS